MEYQSYRGLPTLAGLASLADAAQPGLSVEACVARLKRYHYAFVRLHQIFTARITAEPIYELKTGFAHHAYLCAEHVAALRARVGEMREPPLGLEEVPDADLQVFFDEILAAPTTAELLVGLYDKALPALDAMLARHQADTNPLTDAPSVRLCRFARLELGDMIAFGRQGIACLVDDETRAKMGPWLELLDRCLAPRRTGSLACPDDDGATGDVTPLGTGDVTPLGTGKATCPDGDGATGDVTPLGTGKAACPDGDGATGDVTPLGTGKATCPDGDGATGDVTPLGTGKAACPTTMRHYSSKPYVYDPVPRRDERFHDLYNQGVNAEAFLYDADMAPRPKTLMMLYKRLREIDVPEMMASIIQQTAGKPWGYYHDMSRQLWDEARHAMMGEVGFVALGVDWTQARITHNWSLRLNTECSPLERHAVLYFIEQGLMTKTGKRYEWEVGVASGLPLIATIQDYDWADEVLHAQLGREWYIPQIGDWKEALAYGDQCWSRVLSNWTTVRDQGLTQHENWWPAIYRQACAGWGIDPDPKVLAFAETYENARADLKTVTGSA